MTNKVSDNKEMSEHIAKTSKLVEPDEIDELINNVCMHSVVKDGVQTIVYEGLSPKDLKAKLLALKSKWEAEARIKEWLPIVTAKVNHPATPAPFNPYGLPVNTPQTKELTRILRDYAQGRIAELNQLTNGGKR